MPVIHRIGVIDARRKARKRQQERAKQEAQKLKDLFTQSDKDGNGSLDETEVSAGITEIFGQKPDEKELKFIMIMSDPAPPAGILDVEAFACAIFAWRTYQEEFAEGSELAQLFDECDTDKSGALSEEQLQDLLGKYSSGEVSMETTKAVLKAADAVSDGQINRIELKLAIAHWYQMYIQNLESEHDDGEAEKADGAEAENKPEEKPAEAGAGSKSSKSCSIL